MRPKKERAEMCSDAILLGDRHQSDSSMPLAEFMYMENDLLEVNQGYLDLAVGTFCEYVSDLINELCVICISLLLFVKKSTQLKYM
jgi:hypothetical protein